MTTGDGKYGALGHGDWNSVSRPKLIGIGYDFIILLRNLIIVSL